VSRFTVTKTDPPRIDPASEEIVITFLQGGHNGATSTFGNDGMLYISQAMPEPDPPDELNTGQDISDLLSSILRIDVNRKDKGMNYAVPKDNPFVAMKGARPEVLGLWFRNPWRMGFDRQTGGIVCRRCRWELWEMIHGSRKAAITLGRDGRTEPVKPEKVGPTPCLRPIELPHTIACSVTGGYVYRGKKFPELRGGSTSLATGNAACGPLASRATAHGDAEIARPSFASSLWRGQDGELYFLDYDGGTMHTIERNDGVARTRTSHKLSETGLFAPEGPPHRCRRGPVMVNSRQWQMRDGRTLGRLPRCVVGHPAHERKAIPGT